MKTVRVVAAVICDSIEEKNQIFATARGYGEFKGQWEFPGGKIEAGETPQQALVREIQEELDTEIRVGDLIDTIEYDYPDFYLSMDCFWCEVVRGQLKLLEAEAGKWLTRDKLYSVRWLPADVTLIAKIQEEMNRPRIIQIIIAGSSGYCSIEESYTDKVIISPDSISYEYVPGFESERNPMRKWLYQTNSPIFKYKYRIITDKIRFLKDMEERFALDIGEISFHITYMDGSVWERTFYCPGDDFADLFKEIKVLVPECEYMPVVLLTNEDYDTEE